MWFNGNLPIPEQFQDSLFFTFKPIPPPPSFRFCRIYNSQIIRSMVSGSLISVICDRVLDGYLPALSFGTLTLCYQINQCCQEGENGRKKKCFSGCLDLFSLSRIPFMKTPGQAVIQKYSKNKVVIITAYILALSKSEYDYISNITEKSLAFKYVA